MTERTIFDELQEDFERQRLESLWRRYGLWISALALAVVVGTAAASAYHAWKTDRDQRVTAAYLDAAREQPDAATSIAQLRTFAAAYPGNALADFALLRAGALAADQGDSSKATVLFDAVADDGKADPAFRQLGVLLSVRAQMDKANAADLLARLDPLTQDRAPWRFSALETQGYLALSLGDKEKAKKIFTLVAQDARAPQDIAARANDILRSLD